MILTLPSSGRLHKSRIGEVKDYALFLFAGALLLPAMSLLMSWTLPTTVAAATPTATINCPTDEPNCGGNTGLFQINFSNANLHTIFQLVFGVIGAAAVIFMMVAGIRLILSAGDPEAMKDARQTIIYASIGLVVAVSAELIVTFLLARL